MFKSKYMRSFKNARPAGDPADLTHLEVGVGAFTKVITVTADRHEPGEVKSRTLRYDMFYHVYSLIRWQAMFT